MLGVLIVVAVLVAVWALLWQRQPRLAFGIFIGLVVGALFYTLVQGYFTGSMDDIPVWLPPLPLTIVALALIAYGAYIWLRADEINNTPPPAAPEADEHHHH